MKRIALIIALTALTSQATDVVLYSQAAPSLAYPAPVARTGQTNSYAARDDGALTNGVAWPNPRFTVQANTNVVQDNLTGLMWTRDVRIFGVTNWAAAVTNCNALDYGGYTDWRLPNIRELTSLINYQFVAPPISDTTGTNKLSANTPFRNFTITGYGYWSATARMDSRVEKFIMNDAQGNVSFIASSVSNRYTWPCRGPQ